MVSLAQKGFVGHYSSEMAPPKQPIVVLDRLYSCLPHASLCPRPWQTAISNGQFEASERIFMMSMTRVAATAAFLLILSVLAEHTFQSGFKTSRLLK